MQTLNRAITAKPAHSAASDAASGDYITMLGEPFYCIQNYDAMDPFFISLISSSDHWLFISTTGGLTAGRQTAEHALFPYYTVDKITEGADHTGSKTLMHVSRAGETYLWEPFSERYRGIYDLQRNLYKNIPGTVLIFEEYNADLDVAFRYAWRTSPVYGFVKTAWLENRGASACGITLLDGLQNLLPAQVEAQVQNQLSVLLDAYKRSELIEETGLGLFALSSRLTDMAEPSEALRANTVWQAGLSDEVSYLLSSRQLDTFRDGFDVQPEHDVRGHRGAYFVRAEFELAPQAERSWHFVAEIEQDGAAVVNLNQALRSDVDALVERLEADMEANTEQLTTIVASADGLQLTDDHLSTAHHFANVMFNVMRGGIFADGYTVDKADLIDYINTHHRSLLEAHADFFDALPDSIRVTELRKHAESINDRNLIRLCTTYLPLTFSRRHGDPSRPWNQFAINIRTPDGKQRLDYQGNWRDIFQNWEALAFSYPEYLQSMISTFLNATTFDGYNPYRIMRSGIDWEVPEPDNPWANIGYWSDHQIIYLQKLLEAQEQFYPGTLADLLTRQVFTYANVPYQIKAYADMLESPYDTIAFDWDKHHHIEAVVEDIGSDGRLVMVDDGQIVHTTLAEKLLTLLLAKLVNFVPEGGIWMNTQRPEWNDANNALVGKGLSVVTLGYLLRFVTFFKELLTHSGVDNLALSVEVASLLHEVYAGFQDYEDVLSSTMTDKTRRQVMDRLGQAGSAYRMDYYADGLSGQTDVVSTAEVIGFLSLVEQAVGHSLEANRRDDDLYHAYNILHLEGDSRARVAYLYEMLEGQVSILSSGVLAPKEALTLLTQLRDSTLYREDQHSYILYPDRSLPGFMEKNTINADAVAAIPLVHMLVEAGDPRLMVKNATGGYHFGGDIRNIKGVRAILDQLAADPRYAKQVEADAAAILTLFEETFDHSTFTGRSGSFFAYEGLGSIYWHMVSKLLLAAQEVIFAAHDGMADNATVEGLIDAYYDIRAGMGFNKSPAVYGAFPTDPYSHSPGGRGAKQPGMTGMVKEEVLTRLGELGLRVRDGKVTFDPLLLRTEELLSQPTDFHYYDVEGQKQPLDVPAGALVFTFCQVPIVVQPGEQSAVELHHIDGDSERISGGEVSADWSQHIFQRDGNVKQVTVTFETPTGLV